MKCKIKKLNGVSIYYLHDSDKCSKCQAMMKSDLEITRSYQKLEPQKKIPSKESISENYKPLKELDLGAQKVLKSEFVFPVSLDTSAKIPSKQNKVLKRICSKNVKAVKTLQISKIPSNYKKIPSKQNKELKRMCKDLKAVKTLTKIPSNYKKNNSKSVKTVNESKKETPVLKRSTTLNSVKQKSCNSDKVNGSKVPSKGTLKRKRWYLNKLIDKNDDYEDDLFEDQKFEHFQTLLEDETDSSEKYEDLQTPVFPFSFSPIERTPSPTYQDCFSPTQMSIYRKGAEEFHYRRNIRRRLNLKNPQKEETPQVNPFCREDDIKQRLKEVVRILNEQQSQIKDSSDSDDEYFSDLLNPCEVNP